MLNRRSAGQKYELFASDLWEEGNEVLYLLEMRSNISLASASFMFKAHVNLHFDQ